ncbi:type II toxin-antitoxin system ParD family antitoxin [Burkholderia sp. AU31624]|uniref:type II toxin-antitoxin system ParD family antitoxin n=1 Tax=Burkholderia sp. AU31624 TaxID=2879629 RepID=UPI001CF28D02|nr:type II toxin-antitoxin system ParD family antitoxin [Burkholderia sp. AU31624]MCA8258275.1 type II toxin-antitoxin system ParD family antitoxin [Burkholderia sp. AU31624]
MNVNLTPNLEAMVKAKVASGLYNNASEVVREALRLMAARDQRDLPPNIDASSGTVRAPSEPGSD